MVEFEDNYDYVWSAYICARSLGWSNQTLDRDLHAIYDAISHELQALSQAGKKKKEDPSQTKLF